MGPWWQLDEYAIDFIWVMSNKPKNKVNDRKERIVLCHVRLHNILFAIHYWMYHIAYDPITHIFINLQMPVRRWHGACAGTYASDDQKAKSIYRCLTNIGSPIVGIRLHYNGLIS